MPVLRERQLTEMFPPGVVQAILVVGFVAVGFSRGDGGMVLSRQTLSNETYVLLGQSSKSSCRIDRP